MKILLNENIPHDLRVYLRHHQTFTAAYLGWAGYKNGRLLEAAEENGFKILVTGDLSLIASLSAIGWPIIAPHALRIVAAVDAVEPGTSSVRLRQVRPWKVKLSVSPLRGEWRAAGGSFDKKILRRSSLSGHFLSWRSFERVRPPFTVSTRISSTWK